jgi:hypothetical protein
MAPNSVEIVSGVDRSLLLLWASSDGGFIGSVTIGETLDGFVTSVAFGFP